MEYADDGDLFEKIQYQQKIREYINEKQIWKIFIQILEGLWVLHELGIMHRDIKWANVFLFKDSTAKLGDLNVSKILKNELSYTQTGTPYYASPEVWKDEPYDYKSDVWSLGWVLYETVALKPPFRADDMKTLFKKVAKGSYQPISSWYSKDLNAVLKLMIVVDSSKRLSCKELLEHKLIQAKKDALFYYKNEPEKSMLLSTIEFPKNLTNLTERLPESQYMNKNSHIKNKIHFPKLSLAQRQQDEPIKLSNKIMKKMTDRQISHSTVLPQLKDGANLYKQAIKKSRECLWCIKTQIIVSLVIPSSLLKNLKESTRAKNCSVLLPKNATDARGMIITFLLFQHQKFTNWKITKIHRLLFKIGLLILLKTVSYN
jgi:NIMA (never in mitosis gene a)-related kinase 1/4/5